MGSPSDEETNLLDTAFYNLTDPKKCKNLITSFVLTLIKPDTAVRKGKMVRKSVEKKLSNRKLKRIKCNKFQRIYK